MEKNLVRPDPEKVQYIIDCLPTEELLCQLAEEASELCHAALKLRRACGNDNPTPVTVDEAFDNLLEEIADVSLVLQVLGIDSNKNMETCRGIMAQKVDRWAARLDWGSDDA